MRTQKCNKVKIFRITAQSRKKNKIRIYSNTFQNRTPDNITVWSDVTWRHRYGGRWLAFEFDPTLKPNCSYVWRHLMRRWRSDTVTFIGLELRVDFVLLEPGAADTGTKLNYAEGFGVKVLSILIFQLSWNVVYRKYVNVTNRSYVLNKTSMNVPLLSTCLLPCGMVLTSITTLDDFWVLSRHFLLPLVKESKRKF